MSWSKKILQGWILPSQDVFLRGGGPLPPPPTGGPRPRPAAAPAGGSSVGAGCRAGWPAPPPGCRARTGGGCRRRRGAASWSGSAATFPAAGPWRNTRGTGRHEETRWYVHTSKNKPLILLLINCNSFLCVSFNIKTKASICLKHFSLFCDGKPAH